MINKPFTLTFQGIPRSGPIPLLLTNKYMKQSKLKYRYKVPRELFNFQSTRFIERVQIGRLTYPKVKSQQTEVDYTRKVPYILVEK